MDNYDLPDLLKYPRLFKFNKIKRIYDNKLLYLIKYYEQTGLLFCIFRKNDDVVIRFGDFNGNKLDIHCDIVKNFANDGKIQLLNLFCRHAGIQKCIFYFSLIDNKYILVDLRLSLNKFVSPGYIKDLFNKIQINTQEVIKIGNIDEIIKYVENNVGSKYIIKPSNFTTVPDDDNILPAYSIIGE